MECVYKLCILSQASEIGNSESVWGSHVIQNAWSDYTVDCLRKKQNRSVHLNEALTFQKPE